MKEDLYHAADPKGLEVKKWLQKIDFTAEHMPSSGQTHSLAIDLILSNASGPVDVFLNTNPEAIRIASLAENKRTLAEKQLLFDLLTKRFEENVSAFDQVESLRTLSQLSATGEVKSPSMYYEESVILLYKIGGIDRVRSEDPCKAYILQHVVSQFIQGIADPNIRLEVARRAPSTLNEAFSQFKRCIAFWKMYGDDVRSYSKDDVVAKNQNWQERAAPHSAQQITLATAGLDSPDLVQK